MATFLLSILIFGSAGYIVYNRLKSGKSCDECKTACPVKKVSKSTNIEVK
jgi:flavoprotein